MGRSYARHRRHRVSGYVAHEFVPTRDALTSLRQASICAMSEHSFVSSGCCSGKLVGLPLPSALPVLVHHLHQNLSGFVRVAHFS